MPILKNYTADLGRGGAVGLPRASAAAFGAGVSEAAGALAGETIKVAGDFLTNIEETESRKALVHNTEVRAKYAKRLDEAATSGEDLDKIREEFQNDLDAGSQDFQTRRGVDSARYYDASSAQMFDNRANDIAVFRAGAEAKLEGSKLLNSLGEILGSNASYLPQAERDVDAFVSTLKISPQQRAAIAQDLKQNLNVHAAKTNARNDPVGTMKAIEGGAYDMRPEQRLEVMQYAQAAESLQRSRKLHAEQDIKMEQAKRGDVALNEMLALHAGSKLSTFDTKALLRRQDLDPDRKIQIINIYNALALKPTTDPIMANALYADIFRPEGDPRRVKNVEQIDARLVAGVIDPEEHARQRRAFDAREKPEGVMENHFFRSTDAVINPRDALGRILAPDGPMNAYLFRRDLSNLREEWAKDPKKNKDALFEPASREYKENVLPLLNKYRATSIFLPNEKGEVVQQRVPTPDDTLPLVKGEAEYNALKPGDRYRYAGDPPGKFRVKPALKPGSAAGPGQGVKGEIRR
jgi:hypothetical protein